MSDTIRPPWTPEQVAALNAFQRCGRVHPFTCGVCRDRDTDALVAKIEAARAAGEPDPPWKSGGQHALVATADGWVCETCDYTQDWAHAFMAEPPPPHPFAAHMETPGVTNPAIRKAFEDAGITADNAAAILPGLLSAGSLVVEFPDTGNPGDPWMKDIDDPDHLDFASDVMMDLADLAEEDHDGD